MNSHFVQFVFFQSALFFDNLLRRTSLSVRKSFFVLALFLFPLFSFTQKTSKIEILGAVSLEIDEQIGGGAKRLIGDVQLKHEDAFLYCDSAYVYPISNTMDALGHVRIVQGDSLQLYGDSLKYNGNTKKALLRGNNRLVNNDITLTSNYLDYDRAKGVAYYYAGGKMVNTKENNILESKVGHYYVESKTFFFKKDVRLTNPDYTIDSDTLKYNSSSEIVYFLGPTIIKSTTNTIYCEEGWYNTVNNTSKFLKNTRIDFDGKIVEGDTIFYDRDKGYGELICSAIVTDSLHDMIVQGDLIHFFEKQDSVMITKEALLMRLFEYDTLFMHADTFKLSTQLNVDTFKTDTNRILLAYNRVKFFKEDMQGKADSVVYSLSDSVINFYNDPVIWSEENQLTADFVSISVGDSGVDAISLLENAFIISRADSLLENFDQIKGKDLFGYFKEDVLYRIEVKKNAETIYYAKDEDDRYVGVNKASGENMLVFLEDGELVSLTFINSPEATLYPLKELTPKELLLKEFRWRIVERPRCVSDIFR